MKRNPSIETIRVLACLIVIACHLNFFLSSTADTETIKTFFFCLFSDGVSIFWMICGFFLLQETSLSHLWKRCIQRILLPTLLLFALCFVISLGKFPLRYFDHTWYVFVYLTVLAIQPLLRSVAEFLSHSLFRQRAFLIISLILVIINDLCFNRLLHFGFTPLTGVLPASIMVLWGDILYRNRSRLNRRSLLPLSIFLFFGCNLLRTFLQLQIYDAGSDYNLRVWYCSLGFICALAVAVFGLALPQKENFSWGDDRICFLASHTFTIYLVHPLLAGAASHFDLWMRLQDFFMDRLPYIPAAILYLITGSVGLFLLCLALSVCLRALCRRLPKIHRK